MTIPETDVYHQLCGPLLIFEVVFNSVMALALCYLIYLFLKALPIPKVYIALNRWSQSSPYVPHFFIAALQHSIRRKTVNKPLIKDFVKKSILPVLPIIENMRPWDAIVKIKNIITSLMETLDLSEYDVKGNQAVHKSAIIEASAQLKGPMIIGPSCFVANGSLLRDGIILDSNCIVGHCGELKTSIMLAGSKIAHLNFVGDSILGSGANIEGGAVIANYRNELEDKEIFVNYRDQIIATGVQKFGAILGDNTRIGANAVIAPGSMFTERSIVKRGASVDQYKHAKL